MDSQSADTIETRQQAAETWFAALRDSICATFESIETEVDAARQDGLAPGIFARRNWDRDGGGGGQMPDLPPELANDPKALQKALSSGGAGLPKGLSGGGLPGLPGSGFGGGMPPGLPGLPSGKKKK